MGNPGHHEPMAAVRPQLERTIDEVVEISRQPAAAAIGR